jgi:hypothetical protein
MQNIFEIYKYLEWPEEVGCVFEVLSNCEDFMDQILDTDDSLLA